MSGAVEKLSNELTISMLTKNLILLSFLPKKWERTRSKHLAHMLGLYLSFQVLLKLTKNSVWRLRTVLSKTSRKTRKSANLMQNPWAPQAKDLNIGSIFQEFACGFDRLSTQNFIFGPVGLHYILRHFLEGFFEILIFSDLSSSFFLKPSKSDFKNFVKMTW